MTAWPVVALGSVLPFKYGKNLPERKRSHTGEFNVMSSAGHVDSHDEPLTSGSCVVIGRKGTIGATYFCPAPVFPIDTTFFVEGSEQIDIRFAYYLLQNLPLRNMNNDSAVPGLNRSHAESLEIALPAINEQREIASVLSALDDKIESNQRIQSLSLSIARSMFDRSLQSATSSRLSDIATVVLGGTPSKAEAAFWGGQEISWINSGAANQAIILTPTEHITSLGLQNSAAKLMPKGATVLAITGATLGQVAILGIETAGNQSLVGIWGSTHESNAWIHFAIQARINELLTHATGAAQQHVNKQNVEQLVVPVIGPSELDKWGRGVVPLVERAVSAATESLRLAALRDALLPELLSGRVRVGEASE